MTAPVVHPVPPGPPGPPTHTHSSGVTCWWVRRGGIDQWRRVGHTGEDLGPCPEPTERTAP